jgi:hypothetical protein
MTTVETNLLVSLVAAIVSIASSWGIAKSTIDRLKLDVQRLEDELTKARDIYVTYQHFQVVIQSIREDHKELKTDVKEILRLVNEHSP